MYQTNQFTKSAVWKNILKRILNIVSVSENSNKLLKRLQS
jgi:hypothetical protein